jgi:hypothetical protein
MTDNDTVTIEVTHEDAVLRVAVQGKMTGRAADEVMRRAAAALTDQEPHRILFDLRRARLAMPTLDLIKRSDFADSLGTAKDTRTALLCTVRTFDYELLDTLARNRGHVFQTFTDGAAALFWLHQD